MQPSSSNSLTLLSCSPYRPPTSADQINRLRARLALTSIKSRPNVDQISINCWPIVQSNLIQVLSQSYLESHSNCILIESSIAPWSNLQLYLDRIPNFILFEYYYSILFYLSVCRQKVRQNLNHQAYWTMQLWSLKSLYPVHSCRKIA